MSDIHDSTDSGWVTTFVFIAGFILGAGAALCVAPETGTTLRCRLAKGAKAAQEEWAEVASETREAFNALSQEAQQSVKKAATRLNSAVDATKAAILSDPMPPTYESEDRP